MYTNSIVCTNRIVLCTQDVYLYIGELIGRANSNSSPDPLPPAARLVRHIVGLFWLVTGLERRHYKSTTGIRNQPVFSIQYSI